MIWCQKEETHLLVPRGINFDLTCALTRALSYPRGDAIILKRMLHDWSDEDCAKILKNCWKALPECGKLIIMELVISDEAESADVQSNIAFDMDLLMLMVWRKREITS
ncbi:hypothetical protein Bca52824_007076 [Brassica carinata]|uniref:O-methyltransferase C-terminal domain-containing protein n=1 Tax=Brassica carinata TaxID=52824 RepID=A0A8X7W5M0_BRACI|nr:hypothetical protein Bca52824_007076 [Brassica carinata]